MHIFKTIRRSELATGKRLDPAELSREFMKLDLTSRVDQLEKFDDDIEAVGGTDLRKVAEMRTYRNKLHEMHGRLLKVNR